jgi:BioD-like phosphotransacetylase family protein
VKSLYITSVDNHSGKTATCLALGKQFLAKGYQVGYLKPLSMQPWMVEGKMADEDAAFVKQVLNLKLEPWEISPVVLTNDVLRAHLRGHEEFNFKEKLHAAYVKAQEGVDILLLEGGGSMREGYGVGLPTPAVSKEFGSCILGVVRYKDEIRLLDDALALHKRLTENFCGIIINRVPDNAKAFVSEIATPYLEKQGIAVFGQLPVQPGLEAMTVMELVQVLKAKVMTQNFNPEALVETLTVGAMTGEAALSRFRKYRNKAVITGGDRADIQLAALETSTACLILTGNLTPSPLILKQAEEARVAVLLVRENTMETVEAVERVFGRTRLGQTSKLEKFEKLVTENIDLPRLYKELNL